MTIRPALHPFYQQSTELNNRCQHEQLDRKKRSWLQGCLIDPLKVAGAGACILYNLPKLKTKFSLSAAVFVAYGINTLTDKGLKYCNGYTKLSAYITKDKNRQPEISRKMEKTAERLNLVLQTASLFLIFRNFLRKSAKRQIIPLTLNLSANPFLFNLLRLHPKPTDIFKPVLEDNYIYEKTKTEKSLTLNPIEISAIAKKIDEQKKLTCYQFANWNLIQFLAASKELVTEMFNFKNFKNFCISSVREKLGTLETFKKKIMHDLAYLLQLFKSKIENYFVKI